MSSIAIYPGTFDPMTNGHLNIIERSAKVFPELIIAIAADTIKTPLFTQKERIALAQQTLKHLPNVRVQGFRGLLVEFAREQNVEVIVRGIRAIADFEYERQMASMNQHLAPEIETVFLTPDEGYAHISSTFVREISALGGDVSAFVSPEVFKALKKHRRSR